MGNLNSRGDREPRQRHQRQEEEALSSAEVLKTNGSIEAYLEKGDFVLVGVNEGRRCRLHFKEFGDKDSPRKLLLIMGLSAPFTMWINQALYFSSPDLPGGPFHVLVYDHRVRRSSSLLCILTSSLRHALPPFALLDHS